LIACRALARKREGKKLSLLVAIIARIENGLARQRARQNVVGEPSAMRKSVKRLSDQIAREPN
jgi:hypothetical protein